jgi:hypothetical protein
MVRDHRDRHPGGSGDGLTIARPHPVPGTPCSGAPELLKRQTHRGFGYLDPQR